MLIACKEWHDNFAAIYFVSSVIKTHFTFKSNFQFILIYHNFEPKKMLQVDTSENENWNE